MQSHHIQVRNIGNKQIMVETQAWKDLSKHMIVSTYQE